MNKTKVKRIALTMREANASQYTEVRDAVAYDWYDFLKFSMPEVNFILIPNIGDCVVEYLKDFKVDGVILSGGNDIGSALRRDTTEKKIISYMFQNNLPILGICRGLQLFQMFFNGQLNHCQKEVHIAKKHSVHICDDWIETFHWPQEMVVNSYHSFGIQKEKLAEQLIPTAISEDGNVEAVKVKNYKAWAIMWHPERLRPFRVYDKQLIRYVFGLNNRGLKEEARAV